jgi:hypothetical protein
MAHKLHAKFFLFQNVVDTIPLAIQRNAVDSNDRIEDRPTPSKLKFLETRLPFAPARRIREVLD